MQESIVFFVRVQRRRKESSRSLPHLLMSFLLSMQRVYMYIYVMTQKADPYIKTLLFHRE